METSRACPSHNRITFEIADEKEWKCIKRSYFFMALIVSGFYVTYNIPSRVFRRQGSTLLLFVIIVNFRRWMRGQTPLVHVYSRRKMTVESQPNNDNDCDRCSIDSKCVSKIKQKRGNFIPIINATISSLVSLRIICRTYYYKK